MAARIRRSVVTGLVGAFVLGALALAPAGVRAADHRDGPRFNNNGIAPLDINDVYVFPSPANPNNTVIIVTVGGAAVGVVGAPIFFPDAVYEVRISNDGNPLTDELVVRAAFSTPNAALQQSFVITASDAGSGQGAVLAQGVTGRNRDTQLRGGGKVRAGIFDDPFFFDLIAFNKFKAVVETGVPPGTPAPVADRVAPFLPPNFPNNFFGNFNVLAIVVEVPRMRLQSSRNNPNITLWARTLVGGVQFDRMGNPGINTVVGFAQPLNGLPNIQDTFNNLTPADDPALRPVAAERINLAFGLQEPNLTQLVNLLLPDVISFNTTSRAGFPNGRRLEDDVIDTELGLLTNNGLTSDRVINDSVFNRRFPYIAPPLPRQPLTTQAFRALSQSDATEP